MRLLRFGLSLLVVLCLLAPATGAFAPQPLTYTTASVAFRDAGHPEDPDRDRIRSDGRGSYDNGAQRGLEVRMWILGSQDLTIGTFASGRTLRFEYEPTPDTDTPSAPRGSLVDNAFVNVRAIANMTVGDTIITKASFDTAVGAFRWLGSPFPTTRVYQGDSYGSQAVVVERTSRTTWVINTPDPAEGFWDDATQTEYFGGDLSVLLVDRKGKLTPAARYRMPFGLTVTCGSCP